jgi:hypothetical protein
MKRPSVFEHARKFYNRPVIEKLFPGGSWRGREYWVRNPLRSDKHSGSFSIREDGIFFDFATADRGDLISLIARARRISTADAARVIIEAAGGDDE